MQHDWPTAGQSYRLQSKATGCQLGVHGRNGPGWDERRPHVTPRPQGQGAVWLLEYVEGSPSGFRFVTETEMPWPQQGDPLAWFARPEAAAVPTKVRLDSNFERQAYVSFPNDGHYQLWNLRPDGAGYWYLLNVETDLALDGTHEDLYTMALNEGDYQRWEFLHVG